MAFWQYLFLFSSVLIGGGIAQVLRGSAEEARWRNSLPLLLSFSGAYLLGIAAMELMPSVFGDPRLHSGFLEGLPLGTAAAHAAESVGHVHDHFDSNHLLIGIVLHKLPAAFALGLLLRYSGYSRTFTWGCLLVFAVLSPLGALMGEVVSIDPVWRNRVMALVVGSFLHISTTILFEADGGRSHGISPRKLLVVILGMLVAYFTAH